MQEGLFRGKLKAKNVRGEWTEGNLHIVNGVCIITPDESVIGKYGQVYSDTVGQYAGYTDRNGTKIFEGDIILDLVDEDYGVVRYSIDDEAFKVIFNDCVCSLAVAVAAQTIEVRGNIYDNPELLEVDL